MRVAGGSCTTAELTGAIGQTVDYEITVKNTGNISLGFSALEDAKCEGIAGGPGGKELAVGESSTYTCSHVLSAMGLPEWRQDGALRLSWCHLTELPDVGAMVEAIDRVRERAGSMRS